VSIGRRARRDAVAAGAVALCAASLLGSCTPTPRAVARPDAEFLLVSDDSTAWVRTAADTVVVHRAPMIIVALDGRLVELYVAEEAIDYADATFLATRVFRRDLVTGDSTLVFADSTVLREALAYLRTHPTAEPLGDDDEPDPDSRSVEASIAPLEVLGPMLGLEVHVDRSAGDVGTHDTYHASIDLRTGRRLALSQVIAPASAADAALTARRNLGAAVVLAGARAGPLGRAASRALGALVFDTLSFSLVARGDSLAARFLAHDEQLIDEATDSHRYAIRAVPIPAPAWWPAARRRLPRLGPDSTRRLDGGPIALIVQGDSTDSTGTAEVAALTAGGLRPVLRMRGPVRRIIPLGDSLIAPRGEWRQSLMRAFTESGYYSDQVRAASLRGRARPTARQAAL